MDIINAMAVLRYRVMRELMQKTLGKDNVSDDDCKRFTIVTRSGSLNQEIVQFDGNTIGSLYLEMPIDDKIKFSFNPDIKTFQD